jgi:cyclopropane fatty-acyl-phospholipid synthase-like methyltransferase
MKKRIREKAVIWDKEYKKAKLWEAKPHEYSRLATRIVPKGRVLDLGSGEGYDCLFFASRGHSVVGVDISKTAVSNMLQEARRQNILIKGVVSDLNKYKIIGYYDIVISYGALQFLGSKFKKVLSLLKQKTRHGGVHSFYIFGNKGDFFNIAKERFFFPSILELKEIYQDWKIAKLEKKNAKLLMRGDRGEALYNDMFKLLVQKPQK